MTAKDFIIFLFKGRQPEMFTEYSEYLFYSSIREAVMVTFGALALALGIITIIVLGLSLPG